MGIESMDIIKMISSAGIMVKMVLLLLLSFSITSWAIMVMKFKYINKANKRSIKFIDIFWKSKSLSDAYNKSKQFPNSPIARTFRAGYIELKKIYQSTATSGDANKNNLEMQYYGVENVERALRKSINNETTRLAQLIPFLATVGNTTPFIGLFGTVWGIMDSFHGIGQGGSASLAVVAPGISEALVATAGGLAVAIPAVIGYNFFINKIKIIETELQIFIADFLNIVERDMIRLKGKNQ